MRKIAILSTIALLIFAVQVFANPPAPELSTSSEPEVSELDKVVERGVIDSKDIHYYDRDGNKIYPEISTEKFAVVFENSVEGEHLKDLAKKNSDVMDAYILTKQDPQVGYGTIVIFEMKDGCDYNQVLSAVNTFNRLKVAKFASPVFNIDGEGFMFSGFFEMKTKSEPGVIKTEPDKTLTDAIRNADIMLQRGSQKDLNQGVYLIALSEGGKSFFQIINFFAEDARVVYAVPIFKEVTAYAEVTQRVELQGAKLGSWIPYEVRIKRHPKVKIDPSSLTNLKIVQQHVHHKLNPYNVEDIVEGTELVVTGYIQFFSAGDYTLEPRKIAYLLKDDQREIAGEATSNPIEIRVASLIPEKGEVSIIAKAPFQSYQTKVDRSEIRSRATLFLGLCIFSSFIAAYMLVLLVVVVVKDVKARSREEADPVAEALENLKAVVDGQKGDGYASDVSVAVRNFLKAKLGHDFSTGTVDAVKAKVKEAGEDVLAESASEVLEKCEEVSSRDASDPKLQDLISELGELAGRFTSGLKQ